MKTREINVCDAYMGRSGLWHGTFLNLHDNRRCGFLKPPVAGLVAKRTEPGSNILSKQLGLFHGGEMSAAWHFGPALHLEESLCPFPRRMTDIFWKDREPCRNLAGTDPVLDSFLHPGHRTGIRVIVVRQK